MGKSLDFTIGLVDKFTKPFKGIGKAIEQLEKVTNRTTQSFQKIGTGAIALWGVGAAFSALIEPAEEMQRALDFAGLSGVKELDKMRKQAKSFAGEYATSAVDFVNSSILIKNSINGITDRALPKVTEKVNLLAKSTGASAEESTQYMAKMLNDYKQTAIKMGGLNFVDHVSNIAAYAKQNFSMSPGQMQSMMAGANNAGNNYGVDMSEQFAVLGTLNKSMGGAGAGSYEKMLDNMQSAGRQLGITFTDTNGKLLAMPEILTKLQDKFGKNIEGNVKAQNALNRAFGGGAPAVKALMKDSDKLNQHIKAIGQNNGLNLVQKMAEANVKPWDKINAKINNMRESIGRVLLPVFNPLFKMLDGTVGKFSKWLEMFPNLAKWIGIVTAAFLALAAVGAVLAIVGGALSLILSPITLIILGIAAIAAGVYLLWDNWGTIIGWISKKWDEFASMITNSPIVKKISEIGKSISSGFGSAIKYIKNKFIDAVNWLIQKANYLPGVNIDLIKRDDDESELVSKVTKSPDQALALTPVLNPAPISAPTLIPQTNILTGTSINSVDPGGISKEIKNSQSQSVDNSQNINSVTISAPNGLTPQQLQEWQALQNG
ncbi:phage tail tape measure protein [Orbus wheelerorum]|uniref:phage tail tape measure protein n=1 Tax=Orbus wheelerorum TaxID=3074111 RepID=UPI00370D203B